MKKFLSLAGALAVFIYPAAVYFGIKHFEPRVLAVILALLGSLLLIKLAAGRQLKPRSVLTSIFIAGIIVYTLASNKVAGLKLYPAIVSVFLLASFSYSLLHPPTAIERIARITDPDLSEAGVKYTRSITLLWCGFFLLNTAVALYTIFFARMEIWALYNGLVSYLLIGSLLAGEYCYRIFVLKRS